jgi:hypothetical protein
MEPIGITAHVGHDALLQAAAQSAIHSTGVMEIAVGIDNE